MQHKNQKSLLLSGALLASVISTSALAEENDAWNFSAATGIFALNIEGTQGINVNGIGPIELDVDMDFDDVLDYNESGFGLTLSAAKGDWKYGFTFAHLGLEGSESGVDGTATPVSGELLFEADTLEVSANYTFKKYDRGMVGVIGGLRYYKHAFEGEITRGLTTVKRDKDFEWTDVYIGITHAHAFDRSWSWSSQVDIGGGGSDFAYMLNTGVNYKINEKWMTRLYAQNLAFDYENGSKGDDDWYLYDADEFGFGLGINYSW